MDLIQLIVILLVLGIVLWLLNTYLPIAQPIKTLITALIVLVFVLWLLQAVGLFSAGPIYFHHRP